MAKYMLILGGALAVAMRDGAFAGLDALDAIPERDLVARYPYALATYPELHTSLGHLPEGAEVRLHASYGGSDRMAVFGHNDFEGGDHLGTRHMAFKRQRV